MKRRYHTIVIAVGFFLAALLFFTSCKKKEKTFESIDFETTPVQTVSQMSAVQYKKDKPEMMMKSVRMERYSFSKDGEDYEYELYLDGFEGYSFSEDGQLETQITSDGAKHVTTKDGEEWMAYGNVVIVNNFKGERMETDTIWWDREKQLIHTHCYVVMSSPQGLVQGFGMESDEKARNSIIKRPFNSYGVVTADSTKVYVDSVNFVGPLLNI
ncbi:MAG: LPS export ABC transporter periplasmic protein LptC [Bacteroidales bacterium]|nr:LPS export ABC transporter periplasmic protein LptC [Bacteroidales bacterium]